MKHDGRYEYHGTATKPPCDYPIKADIEGMASVIEQVELELEERWRKVFSGLGYSLDKGDLCVIGENLKGVVRIPKKYKDSIVFSPYVRGNELHFADRSMKYEVPSIDISKFRKEQGL